MGHFQILSNHAVEVLYAIKNLSILKLVSAGFVSSFAFLFGLENHTLLLSLLVLVTFDMIIGIAASYKTGEQITSRRALKTASKLGVYAVLCSAAFLVENIIAGATFIDNAMISFLAITEFISIIENAGVMGFAIPKKLLNQIKTFQTK